MDSVLIKKKVMELDFPQLKQILKIMVGNSRLRANILLERRLLLQFLQQQVRNGSKIP